jgi:hypothetical protein
MNWLNKKFNDYWAKDVLPKRPDPSQFNDILHHIRPGDIILESGTTRASQLVKRITQTPWTHVSLYLGRLHDIESDEIRQIIIDTYNPSPKQHLVFESVLGKGNYIDTIETFKDSHIRLSRPYQISHDDIQSIINYAVSHVGADYNLRHFLDLGRFLLSNRLIPRQWRSSLFDQQTGEAQRQICSGMIAKAFMSVHYPILPTKSTSETNKPELIHRNPNLFIPADFDYSPYFKIIKFPKFHTHETPVYHHLPWNHEYVSNDDIGITHSGGFKHCIPKMDVSNKSDYYENISE